jgi:hypothetical protein
MPSLGAALAPQERRPPCGSPPCVGTFLYVGRHSCMWPTMSLLADLIHQQFVLVANVHFAVDDDGMWPAFAVVGREFELAE